MSARWVRNSKVHLGMRCQAAVDGVRRRLQSRAARACSLGAALFCLTASEPVRAAQGLPAASEIVQRMVARAQSVARAPQTNTYTYEKRAVSSELDDRNNVIKSTEKFYQVLLVGGLPFPRLVKVQGRDLTPAELERSNQREVAFRQRVTRVDMNNKAKQREGLVTSELANRFEFQVTNRVFIEGRPTLVVGVAPRSDAPVKTIEDKIFKQVFGTLWVDEHEAEVRKVEASVHGPIPLGWFGAIGSLHKFEATIERARLPDGVWVNQKSSIWIVARKLLSMIRVKTTEEASGFKKDARSN